MKKLLITIFMSTFLTGCLQNNYPQNLQTEPTETSSSSTENPEIENTVKNADIGENIPIKRCLAAKMIALSFGTPKEINSEQRIINFQDTSPEKWYDKYINYVCAKKYMSGNNDKFMPEEYLSVIEAQYIIDQIDKNGKIRINIREDTKNRPISYNLWTEIYIKTLQNISENKTIKEKFNIQAKKVIPLGTSENNQNIKDGFVITDKGLLKCAGIDLMPYIDTEISLWEKENEIIALSDIITSSPTIKNAYIVENSGNVTLFSGGAEKTYEKTENITLPESSLKIANVELTNKKVSNMEFVDEKREKQIKSFNEKKLICVDDETFDISEDYRVYYIKNNKVMLGKKEDIIEGKTYELYLKNNKICAFIFTKFQE